MTAINASVNSPAPHYSVDPAGAFVIDNYNQAKPFSNFLPGIAGLWGVPMWVFYVNRGQCVTSFGIESKDKAILEFQPANKAYRLTPLQGFRTLLKIRSRSAAIFYEPFQHNLASARFVLRQRMVITSHDLRIEEENLTLGIAISVSYFTLPEEPRSALLRRVSIVNTTGKQRSVELVDGLPTIVPCGMTDELLKNISRTAEAWASVSNLKQRAPFYRLKVRMSDRPQVEPIKDGNFYFTYEAGRARSELLTPIVDSSCVFGAAQDFSYPQEFLRQDVFKLPKEQFTSNRTPAAMCCTTFTLAAHQAREFVSLTGHAEDERDLNRFVASVLPKGYVERKATLNAEIIGDIKNYALTNSASPAFNQYTGQTFLDNVLRGGLPVSLRTSQGDIAFNVYSRKHGDPERDYNHFVISPTYFSQGNGNYRDVNQNRRNDIWFNPDVKASSLITFLNLIQADGYNPLVVKGMSFQPTAMSQIDKLINECVRGDGASDVRRVIENGFQPGELLSALAGSKLTVKPSEFLSRVLLHSQVNETATHGEGFWTDHWTYNLDLLEAYLRLYPEGARDLSLAQKVFSFYLNTHYVLPRDQRYALTPQGVRQYHSVKDGSREIKLPHDDHKLRTENGAGAIYYTSLVCKLICIIANKAASFDPSGMGLEMEADKPNWYDALNGLPGLSGSSISETIELKRYCSALLDILEAIAIEPVLEVRLFEELAVFVAELHKVLMSSVDDFSYWQQSNDLKEAYRQRVRAGVGGKELAVSIRGLRECLRLIVQKADKGIAKATGENGCVSTYFTHEVDRYEHLASAPVDAAAAVPVQPLSFRRHTLPLYLEGFVHALRVETDVAKAKTIYARVRDSALFDRKLKMYKVNASLKSESDEIGRCRVFPPGWLENESIWLHMEYKYLLEVLRAGLIEEFYADLKNTLVPFMDPQRYGRSVFENSSFIVSSAHEDQQLHGQGFVARLSGSTAEFLHIWLLMNMGPRPFHVAPDGNLALEFRPALAAWLFTDQETLLEYSDRQHRRSSIRLPENTYAFMLLGTTLVVYHNPERKNTFGKDACHVREYRVLLSGKKKPVAVTSAAISGVLASDIRTRQAERIDVLLR